MEENILDIYKHLQKMSGFQTQIIEEIALLKQEVQSIKRIITEGLVEDTQIRGHTDKLFSAIMELQEEQPQTALTHRLYERERLK